MEAPGAPWRDVPEEFCPWKTAYNRFNRWAAKGLWSDFFLSYEAKLGSVAFANSEQENFWILEQSCSDGIEDLSRGITLCSELPFSNDPHRLKATNCNLCSSKSPKDQRGSA